MRNGLADHWRKSYVAKGGKSMQAVELAAARKDGWRNIAIALIDPQLLEKIDDFRRLV